MPYRNLGPAYTKIQFVTSTEMPNLIYQACVATGVLSNTVYCQRALAAALARDLGLDEHEILSAMPPARTSAALLFARDENGSAIRNPARTGPSNANEEVR